MKMKIFYVWERVQLAAFLPSPCSGIPCKIRHIFEVKISIATKAILLGGDDGSTEEKMRIVVRDTLFAKTMMQRWL